MDDSHIRLLRYSMGYLQMAHISRSYSFSYWFLEMESNVWRSLMKILAFDPSGNFTEGKGTTGYAISLDDNLPHKLGDISANDYKIRQDYWFAHKELIEKTFPDVCVIESYRLFGHKAKEQSGSSLETPQLIGYLEMVCHELNIPVVLQDPSTKQRHADDVLVKLCVIEKKGNKYYYKGELTNMHKRDALRHGLYYRRSLRMKGAK
jgi:hypothetical protein